MFLFHFETGNNLTFTRVKNQKRSTCRVSGLKWSVLIYLITRSQFLSFNVHIGYIRHYSDSQTCFLNNYKWKTIMHNIMYLYLTNWNYRPRTFYMWIECLKRQSVYYNRYILDYTWVHLSDIIRAVDMSLFFRNVYVYTLNWTFYFSPFFKHEIIMFIRS